MVFSTSASPDQRLPTLSDLLKQVAEFAPALIDASKMTWLADDNAAEIPCGLIPDDIFTTIRSMADAALFDVNIVPANDRKKSLLLADMDSTIIKGESLDDMAMMVGLGERIAKITARAMRGELDFEQALDERVAMLAGRPASLFDDALNETKVMDGAVTTIATMRSNGAHCYLVSGGFTAIAGAIAARCGFHGFHANEMLLDDGLFSGKVKKPVLGREAKADFLAHYTVEHGLRSDQSICVGDGANDRAMLQAAGMGVAYQGKPLLREAVPLQLNHTDLTGLLFLQGYVNREFVTKHS